MTDYDLTIIGGGSAGLVLAVAGAKLGKKTALIEKHRLGGDCLWTGCVPSKALLKVAKVAHELQHAEKYGFFREGEIFNRAPDFQKAMAYVRSTQQQIEEEHDNPERFREMGVDVIFGSGHFSSPHTFVVNGAVANRAYRGRIVDVNGAVENHAYRGRTVDVNGAVANHAYRGRTVDVNGAVANHAYRGRIVDVNGAVANRAYRGRTVDVNGAVANRAYRGRTVDSGETRTLTSKKFVISTGSRPAVPPIPGIERCDYLDSESVWELAELPKRLLVVGAGPIGIELGQAFHRLGSEVTIVQRSERILTKEDADVSAYMLDSLRGEGIIIRLNTQIARVDNHIASSAVGRGPVPRHAQSPPRNVVNVTFRDDKDGTASQQFDKILIAAGRAPNVEGLGLAEIGVKVGKRGVEVNNKLQTSVKTIYAAGDVIGHYLFTHVADFQAQLILRNIFFPFSKAIDYSVVPWTTFCEPEVARCGLTEAEAREKYGDVDIFTLSQADVDRAVAEGETRGFTKVIASRWRGKILGVHLVGANAGEVIHEYVLAMQHGIPLRKLSEMIHVYPTFSSSVWRVARKWFSEGTLIRTLRQFARSSYIRK